MYIQAYKVITFKNPLGYSLMSDVLLYTYQSRQAIIITGTSILLDSRAVSEEKGGKRFRFPPSLHYVLIF